MVIFFIRMQIEHSLGRSNVLILSFTQFQILYKRTGQKRSPVRLYRILNYAKLSIKTFERPSECSICVLMKNITIMVESVRFNTQVYVLPNHVQMSQGIFWSDLKSIFEVLFGLEKTKFIIKKINRTSTSTSVQDFKLRKTKY